MLGKNSQLKISLIELGKKTWHRWFLSWSKTKQKPWDRTKSSTSSTLTSSGHTTSHNSEAQSSSGMDSFKKRIQTNFKVSCSKNHQTKNSTTRWTKVWRPVMISSITMKNKKSSSYLWLSTSSSRNLQSSTTRVSQPATNLPSNQRLLRRNHDPTDFMTRVCNNVVRKSLDKSWTYGQTRLLVKLITSSMINHRTKSLSIARSTKAWKTMLNRTCSKPSAKFKTKSIKPCVMYVGSDAMRRCTSSTWIDCSRCQSTQTRSRRFWRGIA